MSDVTGGKKLSIKSMTVTADGQTVTIERDADGRLADRERCPTSRR